MTSIDRRRLAAALLTKAEGRPKLMLQVAELLRDEGDEAAAVDLCVRALALDPADREVAQAGRRFLSKNVPAWHFTMLRDEPRAALYDEAVRRVVKPGMRVLDIGAGSGILAMMAARAGASVVYSCEAEPAIAQIAAEIVAANGYADRVHILPCHSTTLTPDDLGGRVDVLISEIIGIDLLCEHVLPSHEHAIRELLVPGGPVLPARGTIWVAPVSLAAIPKRQPVGTLQGFDLSAFEQLRASGSKYEANTPGLELKGPPVPLFSFDFTRPALHPAERRTATLASDGGWVDGVVQWFDLEVADGLSYDTRPGPGYKSWAVIVTRLSTSRETAPCETIRIEGRHDRTRVTIRTD